MWPVRLPAHCGRFSTIELLSFIPSSAMVMEAFFMSLASSTMLTCHHLPSTRLIRHAQATGREGVSERL